MCILWYKWIFFRQYQICKRKLDSKCEALLILTKDLDQCRQERDQFKLMAEQVQERYQAMKRQLAGVVGHVCLSVVIDQGSALFPKPCAVNKRRSSTSTFLTLVGVFSELYVLDC